MNLRELNIHRQEAPQTAISHEVLRTLPVAINATSLGKLRAILAQRTLIPADMSVYSPAVASRYEQLSGGMPIYFAAPLVPNLRFVNPALTNTLLARINPSEQEGEFNTDHILNVFSIYAQSQAISDFWQRTTGEYHSTSDLVAVASKALTKGEMAQFLENIKELDVDEDTLEEASNPRKVRSILHKFEKDKRQELKGLLLEASKRKGVILFYGSSFLEAGKINLGFESEDEIIVTTADPISSDVIVGVYFLSEVDKADFINLQSGMSLEENHPLVTYPWQ